MRVAWTKPCFKYWNIPFPATSEDMPKGYKTWNAGEHVMVRVADKTIYIARVLHGRMNFSFQFGP